MNKLFIGLGLVIVVVGGVILATGDDTPSVQSSPTPSASLAVSSSPSPLISVSATQKGSYESYSTEKLARAATGDVVLFFRAPWCPTCRALDADIKAHLGDIPAGVTILDVDYDSSTALKQKYGVTYQHTLVQVDASGTQINKWTGSPNLAALLSNIK